MSLAQSLTSSRLLIFLLVAILTGCDSNGGESEDEEPILETPQRADSTTVWVPQDGVVKVEVERYAPKPKWVVQRTPEGFSGDGFLKWTGSFQHGESEGFHPADEPLGSRDEWVIIKFLIEEPGFYRIDIKNFHVHEDGDNDVWLRFPESDDGWHKVGSQQSNDYAFLYWTYGGNPAMLSKGVHTAYLTGRSHGFGLDYVAIYRASAQTPSGRITDIDRTRVEAAPESKALVD